MMDGRNWSVWHLVACIPTDPNSGGSPLAVGRQATSGPNLLPPSTIHDPRSTPLPLDPATLSLLLGAPKYLLQLPAPPGRLNASLSALSSTEHGGT